MKRKYKLFGNGKLVFCFFLTILCACLPDKEKPNDRFLSDHHAPQQKWGYIQRDGALVIKNQYDAARDFAEGLAAVNYSGKWGYINQNGENVIDFDLKEAGQFQDGYAIVKTYEDQWSMIDKTGNSILTMNCNRLYSPKEEISRFKVNGSFGFIKINGDTLATPSFSDANDFISQKALVARLQSYFLMDRSGSLKALKADKVYPAKHQFYRFKSDGKYGFFALDGAVSIPGKFDFATDFHNGLAYVRQGNASYILNQSGTLKSISMKNLTVHSPGYLLESTDEGQYLYDFALNKLSAKPYDMYYRPTEGITAVMKADMWGFIDENGSPITNIEYPLVWEFNEGLGRFIDPNLGIGFINKEGKVVVKPYFVEVKDFNEGLARVQVYR